MRSKVDGEAEVMGGGKIFPSTWLKAVWRSVPWDMALAAGLDLRRPHIIPHSARKLTTSHLDPVAFVSRCWKPLRF